MYKKYKRLVYTLNECDRRYLLFFGCTSRIFENIPQNGPEYSHRNLAIARFLVTAVKQHRWLAVLVGLIVELSPWANSPCVGKGPPCQFLGGGGEGAAKAWHCPLVLLWRVSALVMSAFSSSCQILVMFEPPQARSRQGGGGEVGGSDLPLNSLLRT